MVGLKRSEKRPVVPSGAINDPRFRVIETPCHCLSAGVSHVFAWSSLPDSHTGALIRILSFCNLYDRLFFMPRYDCRPKIDLVTFVPNIYFAIPIMTP